MIAGRGYRALVHGPSRLAATCAAPACFIHRTGAATSMAAPAQVLLFGRRLAEGSPVAVVHLDDRGGRLGERGIRVDRLRRCWRWRRRGGRGRGGCWSGRGRECCRITRHGERGRLIDDRLAHLATSLDVPVDDRVAGAVCDGVGSGG